MWISAGSANGRLSILVIPNIMTNNIPSGVAHPPEVWHTVSPPVSKPARVFMGCANGVVQG